MSDAEMALKWEQHWPLIVAKAWADPKFMADLQENTAEVLAREGLPMLANVSAMVVPMTDKLNRPTMCLPIPEKPPGLTVDMLNDLVANAVVASDCSGTSCCC